MSDFTAFHSVATGRVQGVYYRKFTVKHAAKLGLTGYVRNLPDRSVEIYAEGEKSQIEQLIKHLQEGPPGARVDSLSRTWSEYTGNYQDFSIKY